MNSRKQYFEKKANPRERRQRASVTVDQKGGGGGAERNNQFGTKTDGNR